MRWIDHETRQRETLKVDSEENAKLLCTVLKASGNNIDTALVSVKAHYRGVYTVSCMIEDHILLLVVSGDTIRCYQGMLCCHLADGLGALDATKVEYRDIVMWVKACRPKAWNPRQSRMSTA